MCGIAGCIVAPGARPDAAALERMAGALVHRGPDDRGVEVVGQVGLVATRLSIVDVSPAGHNPMPNEDETVWITFNGEIYNYRELRDELAARGCRFFSHSDTEVIAKAYHRWGTDCVRRFYGMFAFAVAERDSGRLVLARDRLGIKPLYLSETGDRLRFASSLPALLAAGEVDTTIDPVALHHYLSFHSVVPPPRTILAGVRKLPPATVRVVEPDGTSVEHRFWAARHERLPEHAGMTAREWANEVLATLRRAVRRRMVADVPVGVLLSGGLDSSLIVALLAEQGQRGLTTFSIGFEAAPEVFTEAHARLFKSLGQIAPSRSRSPPEP